VVAQAWVARRWATMHLAQPTGATGAGLTGVSCTSARACTAAGYDNGPNLGGTLAEHWNGSKWSIQPTPSPGSGGIPFAAVSCGSTTSCTAVGYYDFDDPGFASNTLAEHWNGHSWSSQSLPPVGNPGADLTSISCRPSACTAAGYYLGQSDEGPGTAPLAMRRNGTTWAVQATPGDATLNETSALTGFPACRHGRAPQWESVTPAAHSFCTGMARRGVARPWRATTPSTRSCAHPLPRASPSAAAPLHAGTAGSGHRSVSAGRRGGMASA
jgi:hypothetical protein